MSFAPNSVEESRLSAPRGLFGALLAPPTQRARIIWTASIGIVVVIVVGLVIRTGHFDFAVVQFLNGYHHGAVGALTNAVYKIFEPAAAIIGTVVLTGIILALTRNLKVASTFAATIAATWVSLAVVKLIVHRHRPDSSLLPFPYNPAQIDASYPSGHTAFVTAVVVTIVLGLTAGRSRWLGGIIGGFLILGVGTALVIDGVHYPSDVIASIIWGIVVAPLARIIWVFVVLRGIDGIRPRRSRDARHLQ
ncbi:MAG: phosphatase PAP2 family protein [Microbacteriaceae bacterium]